jgi:ribonuclease HII
MNLPTFNYEEKFWNQGLQYVAGVDEVGRGCFAGPVVAAAVVLPSTFTASSEINDSKLLSAKKREQLAEVIKKHAHAFSIAEIPVSVINEIGVGKAAQKAFAKAIMGLKKAPQHILIDAFRITAFDHSIQTPIIHGDRISISIAAASIIAKVYRDELMQRLHDKYAVYDFFTNKGYGTKKHREAIKQYGLCEMHRTSFNLQRFTL